MELIISGFIGILLGKVFGALMKTDQDKRMDEIRKGIIDDYDRKYRRNSK